VKKRLDLCQRAGRIGKVDQSEEVLVNRCGPIRRGFSGLL